MIINDGGGNYKPKSVKQRRNVKGRNSRKKSNYERDRRNAGVRRKNRSRPKKWSQRRWAAEHRLQAAKKRARSKKHEQLVAASKVSSVSRPAVRTGKTSTRSPYTAPKPYVPPKKKPTVAKKPVRPNLSKFWNPSGLALEHYTFQNTFNFASDGTGTSLDNVLREIRYEGEIRSENEYVDYFEEKTTPPTLNIGLTASEFEALFDASSVEKYAPDGTVYYDVNLDLPNTQGFRQIQVRITEIN